MYRMIILMAITLTGCAHSQLKHQSVHQAHSVADIHTQQVLDNLAKFAHNPNALPHFSYPSLGTSEVTGDVSGAIGFNFLPSTLEKWDIGATAKRGQRENYTLTPINDPRKLELMRCAYQRAVSSCCQGGESGACPNCDRRFNRFYLGSSTPPVTQETHFGWPVYTVGETGRKVYAVIEPLPAPQQNNVNDEATADRDSPAETLPPGRLVDPNPVATKVTFFDLKTDELVVVDKVVPATKTNDVSSHTEKTGFITSECLYSPCWFHVGCKRDIPKHCAYVGKYCDTYVWVPQHGVDQLTKLTIAILDYAIYDPALPPGTRQKEVVAYLDSHGSLTTKSSASYEVKAALRLDDDTRTVLGGRVPSHKIERDNDPRELVPLPTPFQFEPFHRRTIQPGPTLLQLRNELDNF